MQDKPRRTILSLHHLAGGLLAIFCLAQIAFSSELSGPQRLAGAVVCRKELGNDHREQLAIQLSKISGWPDLKFDVSGILREGKGRPVGGSKSARELLAKAILGSNAVVLEDVSRHRDVVFMRVIPGRWKTVDGPPAFVVQIDIADFEGVMGDEQALQAFNVL